MQQWTIQVEVRKLSNIEINHHPEGEHQVNTAQRVQCMWPVPLWQTVRSHYDTNSTVKKESKQCIELC